MENVSVDNTAGPTSAIELQLIGTDDGESQLHCTEDGEPQLKSTDNEEPQQQNIENGESSGSIPEKYPPKPVRPLDSDCCGSGCSTCVFDLYDLDVKRWQKRCEEMDMGLDPSSLGPAATLPSIYEYARFKIIDIDDLSATIKLFTFEIPVNGRLPIRCGQHLIARCFTIDHHAIIRPYTPVSRATQRGSFVIAVKLYDTGQMSRCIRNSWTLDASVEWRGPFGEFRYQPNTFSDLILIAGGTGVTPMLQIIRNIVDNEEDYTKVNLLYSIHRASELIMKKELNLWTSFWNFSVKYFVTDQNIKDVDAYRKAYLKYGDVVHLGRISDDVFLEMSKRITKNDKTKVLICGPRSFNQHVHTLVRTFMKVEENNVVIFE